MHPKTHEFRDIFLGLEIAYGRYIVDTTEGNGKHTGTQRGLKHGNITMEMWSDHLTGIARIGIVPINEESKCRWGAIDLDPPTYPMPKADLLGVLRKIAKSELPLIPCRSKSGGLHLYYHVADWIDAKLLRLKLDGFAAILGLGHCEVFPRQVQIDITKEQRGNYINLPYFGEGEKCETHAYAQDGNPLNLADWFVLINEFRRPFHESVSVDKRAQEGLPDGPPCISRLLMNGIPEGTRNTILTQLCVYAKMKYPENWEPEVLALAQNRQFFTNPEPRNAIEATIRSYRTKDYSYQCNNPPMCNYCDRGLCRTRPFGIGSSGEGLPLSGTMIRYDGEEPHWEVCVVGSDRRVSLTEDALVSFREYRKCVLRSANVPIDFMMKDADWAQVISRHIREALVAEVPPEETEAGLLRYQLEEFLTGRAQAREMDEIAMGKPWLASNKLHYFRLMDFYNYLERIKFDRTLSKEHLGKLLRNMLKLDSVRKKVRGKQTLLYTYFEITHDGTPFAVPTDINPEEIV